MGIYAVVGAKAYIGGVLVMGNDDLVSGDFASQTWVEIGNLIAMGTIGGDADIQTYVQLAPSDPNKPARVRKMKAAIDSGTMELVAVADYASAGQLAVIAALQSDETFAFKVDMADAPAGGTPSKRMFTAFVAQAGDVLDDANAAYRLGISLAIDSNIVRVSAA